MCAAVVGQQNNPLYIKTLSPVDDEVKFHYMVHASLDAVEEKVGQKGRAVRCRLFPSLTETCSRGSLAAQGHHTGAGGCSATQGGTPSVSQHLRKTATGALPPASFQHHPATVKHARPKQPSVQTPTVPAACIRICCLMPRLASHTHRCCCAATLGRSRNCTSACYTLQRSTGCTATSATPT